MSVVKLRSKEGLCSISNLLIGGRMAFNPEGLPLLFLNNIFTYCREIEKKIDQSKFCL